MTFLEDITKQILNEIIPILKLMLDRFEYLHKKGTTKGLDAIERIDYHFLGVILFEIIKPWVDKENDL